MTYLVQLIRCNAGFDGRENCVERLSRELASFANFFNGLFVVLVATCVFGGLTLSNVLWFSYV
jgi:hypothetical protein